MIHQVLTWILEGNSEHLIREAIAETWPGQADAPLMLAAFEAVATSAQNARDFAEDWCIESLRFLYQKQVELGDYGGAMSAVLNLHKLATKGATKTIQTVEVINVDSERARLAKRIAGIG